MAQDRFYCKECGTVDSRKFIIFENAFKCKVCGAINPLYDTYKIVEHKHSGKINVDGIPTVSSLLLQARQFLDAGKFDKANKLYKEVIVIEPQNHVAWWGCYCCEKGIAAYYKYSDKYGNSGPCTKAEILMDLINQYAKNAVNNAPLNYVQAYREVLDQDIQFIDDVKKGKYNR